MSFILTSTFKTSNIYAPQSFIFALIHVTSDPLRTWCPRCSTWIPTGGWLRVRFSDTPGWRTETSCPNTPSTDTTLRTSSRWHRRTTNSLVLTCQIISCHGNDTSPVHKIIKNIFIMKACRRRRVCAADFYLSQKKKPFESTSDILCFESYIFGDKQSNLFIFFPIL